MKKEYLFEIYLGEEAKRPHFSMHIEAETFMRAIKEGLDKMSSHWNIWVNSAEQNVGSVSFKVSGPEE